MPRSKDEMMADFPQIETREDAKDALAYLARAVVEGELTPQAARQSIEAIELWLDFDAPQGTLPGRCVE